jgi:osmotically-inducible protein OsmY
MKLRQKHINWVRGAYAVPLMLWGLCGMASPVNAQPAANSMLTRSTASSESIAPGSGAANDELRQRVAAALHAQPYLDDRHINVSVSGGRVEISGFVYSTADLVDALQTARASAAGVTVVDRLSIEREGRH